MNHPKINDVHIVPIDPSNTQLQALAKQVLLVEDLQSLPDDVVVVVLMAAIGVQAVLAPEKILLDDNDPRAVRLRQALTAVAGKYL